MTRRMAVLGMLLFAVLGVPRTSDAGLFEFIWEMSGPRMVGATVSCLFTVDGKLDLAECRAGNGLATIQAKRRYVPLLVLGGGGFVSTGHDSATKTYDWGDATMLVLEPGALFLSKLEPSKGGLRVGHGVGISYDVLFGKDFQTFDKFAFTFTPVEVSYWRLVFALKLRLYPNGFTNDEFSPGPPASLNRGAELVWGGGVSYIFR
jgi:hypothetical protein